MGLDIYLYKYEDFKETRRKEDEHEEYANKYWSDLGEYDTLTQEQKDNAREHLKQHANSLGLDDWGSDNDGKHSIEMSSEKYPNHMFKVGYFRSSYNDSGIQRILTNLGLPTLTEVLGYEGEYLFQPNWEKSLSFIQQLRQCLSEKDGYRVQKISANMFSTPEIKTEQQALAAFLNEKQGNPNIKYNYSNKVGTFNFEEPDKVIAYIPGTYTLIGPERECMYVIYESDNKWYEQSLEIVQETIEFVLKQEDKEKYYLHWSG